MAAAGDPRAYYRTLGVPRTASADDIKTAFRERAKELHPDSGGTGDEARFRRLLEAYNTLREPQLRLRYDAEGLASERGGNPDPGVDMPEPASQDSIHSAPSLTQWRWPNGFQASHGNVLLGAALALSLVLAAVGWHRASERAGEIESLTRRLDHAEAQPTSPPTAKTDRGAAPRVYAQRFSIPGGGRRHRCGDPGPVARHRRRSAPRHRRPAGTQRLDGRGRGRDRARGRRAGAAARCLGARPAAGRGCDPVPGRARHSGRAGGRPFRAGAPAVPRPPAEAEAVAIEPACAASWRTAPRPGCRSGTRPRRRAPARGRSAPARRADGVRVGGADSEIRSACGAAPRPMKKRSAGVTSTPVRASASAASALHQRVGRCSQTCSAVGCVCSSRPSSSRAAICWRSRISRRCWLQRLSQQPGLVGAGEQLAAERRMTQGQLALGRDDGSDQAAGAVHEAQPQTRCQELRQAGEVERALGRQGRQRGRPVGDAAGRRRRPRPAADRARAPPPTIASRRARGVRMAVGIVQVRAQHQAAWPPLPRRPRASASGTMPSLVHRDRLEMLAEPGGKVAQAAVAERLGQHRVAGASQRQQAAASAPSAPLVRTIAVRLGGEAQMPQPTAAAARWRIAPAASG